MSPSSNIGAIATKSCACRLRTHSRSRSTSRQSKSLPIMQSSFPRAVLSRTVQHVLFLKKRATDWKSTFFSSKNIWEQSDSLTPFLLPFRSRSDQKSPKVLDWHHRQRSLAFLPKPTQDSRINFPDAISAFSLVLAPARPAVVSSAALSRCSPEEE